MEFFIEFNIIKREKNMKVNRILMKMSERPYYAWRYNLNFNLDLTYNL